MCNKKYFLIFLLLSLSLKASVAFAIDPAHLPNAYQPLSYQTPAVAAAIQRGNIKN